MQKTMNPFNIKQLINFYLFQCGGGGGGGGGDSGTDAAGAPAGSAAAAAAAGIAAGQAADAAPSQSDSVSLSNGQTFGADMGTGLTASDFASEAMANMPASQPAIASTPAPQGKGIDGISMGKAGLMGLATAGLPGAVFGVFGNAAQQAFSEIASHPGVPASSIPATVDGAGDESKPGLINSKEDTRDEPKIKPIVIDYYNAPYEQAITQEQQKSIAAANASMYGSGSGWGGAIAKYQKSKLGA